MANSQDSKISCPKMLCLIIVQFGSFVLYKDGGRFKFFTISTIGKVLLKIILEFFKKFISLNCKKN